jgi:hypothetical protein
MLILISVVKLRNVQSDGNKPRSRISTGHSAKQQIFENTASK